MTTNQDRAAGIILGKTATDAARALADAGLLLPDHPDDRPIGAEVRDSHVAVSIDLERATARDLGHLAAILLDLKANGADNFRANHSEGNNP